jgi:cytochrome c556
MNATTSALSLCLLTNALGPCSESPPPRSEIATETQPLAPPSSAVETAREPRQQQTQTAHAFMRDHAKEADELRRAVIAGRFDLIHRVSAIVASDAWSSNLRPDYLPHVKAVQRAAALALDASSVRKAGAALGELGAACATCHREHGGPPPPATEEGIGSGVGSMAIHAAAEQALWEGLFTPSDATWKRGAERLAQAPELSSDVEDVAALGGELRDLALQAAAGNARSDVYGKILSTCSSCHRRLAIEPR